MSIVIGSGAIAAFVGFWVVTWLLRGDPIKQEVARAERSRPSACQNCGRKGERKWYVDGYWSCDRCGPD